MSARPLLPPRALPFVRLVPALCSGVLLGLVAATARVPPLARTVGIGLVVASALLAFVPLSTLLPFLPKRAELESHASAAFAIFAVAAAGQAPATPTYAIGAALFTVVLLACLRAPHVARRPLRDARDARSPGDEPALPRARARAVAIFAISASAVAALVALSLPRLTDIIERQVQRLAGDVMVDGDKVGFDTKIRVGSLRQMLQSDRVVMRVEGRPVTYLRGAVLDRYDARVWSSTVAASPVTVAADAVAERATTRIELSRAALAGRAVDPRWFLPEDACDLRTPSGRIALDAHAAAHPVPPNDARWIEMRRSSADACALPASQPVAPWAPDLALAPKIRAPLTAIAREWTRGARTPREAIDAITRQLSRQAYSLEDRREGNVDTVVEFLEKRQGGHCELFASALALLARTIDIPTRLAVGYRVDEVNPLTGMAVVRDRNAHTWVEAFVDGRWQPFDPTPLSELRASTRASRWDHVAEALSFSWDRAVGVFARIGLARAGFFSAVLAVLLVLVRRRLARRRAGSALPVRVTSRPLPAFEALATALARAGFERAASEPLERFARRVDASGEPWSAEVADALARYADLRYGGLGDEPAVSSRLDDVARRVASVTQA